jgi:hypothetical protein
MPAGDAASGTGWPVLWTLPDEPEQRARLSQFREHHPGIAVRAGAGYWQAVIPEPGGATVLIRYWLRDLLDKANEVLAGHG